MTRKSLVILLTAIIGSLSLPLKADTFKHKETGETFYGFRTQKNTANQSLVYNDSGKKLIPVNLRDYEVTMDSKGRRNSVVMVSLTSAEILLSETVAEIVSDAIIKASNTGPQFILLKIDNPGGRGEYMKKLCSTIAKTDNCKIAAYISGGSFGGAYSAAAVLALACDKIFIAPTATISSVAPFGNEPGEDFIKMYSSDSLTSYSVFAATLAEQHQRPSLLAKALLDKKIALVEVTDTDGKVSLTEKNQRLPNQTIVKTICEGVPEPLEKPRTSDDTKETASTIPADIHSRVLNLTGPDAVRLKVADRIAYSVQDILAEMNAPDAQIANAPGIDTVVKQFAAAKKNIRQRLARIEFLENRASTLEDQLDKLEEELRTTPATRTQTNDGTRPYRTPRGNVLGGGSVGYSSTQIDSTNYDQVQNMPYDRTNNPDRYNMVRRNARQQVNRSESLTSAEPSFSAEQAKTELFYVLNELISEYRQTIKAATRWKGSLPEDTRLITLENNMNSAMALAENLRIRSSTSGF